MKSWTGDMSTLPPKMYYHTMLCQSDDIAGDHTTTEACPYLYYYSYDYEWKE